MLEQRCCTSLRFWNFMSFKIVDYIYHLMFQNCSCPTTTVITNKYIYIKNCDHYKIKLHDIISMVSNVRVQFKAMYHIILLKKEM